MKVTCQVIEDLLPLYHDGVCSQASGALVEEHIKDCPSCQEELRRMEEALVLPHVAPDSGGAQKAITSAWKKAKRKAYVKGIVLAAVLCVLVVGVFLGLTQWDVVPVSADAMQVSDLSELPDGSTVFRLEFTDGKAVRSVRYDRGEDGSLYVTPVRPVLAFAREKGRAYPWHVFQFDGGERKSLAFPSIPMDGVTKLYVGPRGEGTLLWEEGMDLPAATEDVIAAVTLMGS